MSNLSHWDYAESFTGREAAALILGIDPITDDLAVIEPLMRRMNDAYTATERTPRRSPRQCLRLTPTLQPYKHPAAV